MKSSSFTKFAGLVGILASICSLSAVFASTLLCGVGCGEPIPPPFSEFCKWGSGGRFSWRSNALSDLGISKVANIFNYSLILGGISFLIFAIGFVKAYPRSVLFYLGNILAIIGFGSLSLVGIFTEAYGLLHLYVSFGYFFLVPTAIITVGFAFRRMNMKTKGSLSTLIGMTALLVMLGAFSLQWHTLLGYGIAVPEMVEAVIIVIWIVWMGASLLRG